MGKEDLKHYMEDHAFLQVMEAAEHAQVSLPTVYAFIKQEGMQRLSKGIYAAPDTWIDEMLLLSLRTNVAVFSHESALLLHHLTDREPCTLTVTVPSNYNASHLTNGAVKVFYVNPDLMGLGKIICKTPEGNSVPCYDLERTICDIIRSRSQIEEQVLLESIKTYIRRSDKRLDLLSSYAEKLRVSGVVSQYVEVLL